MRPPADAVTAGPMGAERAWSGGGLRAALPLAAGLGSGAGRACHWTRRRWGGSQPRQPRGAELQALAWLSLCGAAFLAPSSAGGLRVLTAASAARGEGRS